MDKVRRKFQEGDLFSYLFVELCVCGGNGGGHNGEVPKQQSIVCCGSSWSCRGLGIVIFSSTSCRLWYFCL